MYGAWTHKNNYRKHTRTAGRQAPCWRSGRLTTGKNQPKRCVCVSVCMYVLFVYLHTTSSMNQNRIRTQTHSTALSPQHRWSLHTQNEPGWGLAVRLRLRTARAARIVYDDAPYVRTNACACLLSRPGYWARNYNKVIRVSCTVHSNRFSEQCFFGWVCACLRACYLAHQVDTRSQVDLY